MDLKDINKFAELSKELGIEIEIVSSNSLSESDEAKYIMKAKRIKTKKEMKPFIQDLISLKGQMYSIRILNRVGWSMNESISFVKKVSTKKIMEKYLGMQL
jgi:hypothetical protein